MSAGRRYWIAVLVLGCALLQGCATTTGANADPRDPWEGMNRKVFAFNEKLDEAVVAAAAADTALGGQGDVAEYLYAHDPGFAELGRPGEPVGLPG